jgi:hypothetical protein
MSPATAFAAVMILMSTCEAFVAVPSRVSNGVVASRQHVGSLHQTPTDVEALRAKAAKAREEVSRLEKVWNDG